MTKTFDVKVNKSNLDARLMSVKHGAALACAQAVHQSMQKAFRQSQREVPVRFGVLKNSGQLGEPEELEEGRFRVAITYGGAASKYAERQHDDVTLNHPGGGKAHFIIDPVRDAVPDMKARLKAAILKLGK